MRRLSPGTLLVGVFAILFGLVVAYGAKRYMQHSVVEAEKPTEEKRYPVPLAAMDLPAGRSVAETDILSVPLTAAEVAKAKFPPLVMDKVSQITGRVLKQPLKRGQPFEPASFYPAGTGPDLSESLKPGERAVTVSLDQKELEGTFVTPGSVVDVVFRSKPGNDVPDATVTLLSGVRVLAFGQNTFPGTAPKKGAEGGGGDARTVTLAVSPSQARALKVVQGRGDLWLTLRNSKDEATTEKGGPTTLPGLFGMKQPQQPFVSEIYRRGALSTMTFADGQRQSVKLDPPFGLPVTDKPKGAKAGSDDLEVWPTGSGYGRSREYPARGGHWGGFDN